MFGGAGSPWRTTLSTFSGRFSSSHARIRSPRVKAFFSPSRRPYDVPRCAPRSNVGVRGRARGTHSKIAEPRSVAHQWNGLAETSLNCGNRLTVHYRSCTHRVSKNYELKLARTWRYTSVEEQSISTFTKHLIVSAYSIVRVYFEINLIFFFFYVIVLFVRTFGDGLVCRVTSDRRWFLFWYESCLI